MVDWELVLRYAAIAGALAAVAYVAWWLWQKYFSSKRHRHPHPHPPSPPGPGTSGIEVFFAPAGDSDHVGDLTDATTVPCTDAMKASDYCTGWGFSKTSDLQQELDYVDTVTEARKSDTACTKTNQDYDNPYRIRYSAYNLLWPELVSKLIDAYNADVYVQCMVERSQLDPCAASYNTYGYTMRQAGLSVPCFQWDSSDGDYCGISTCEWSDCRITGCQPTAAAKGSMPDQENIDPDDIATTNLLPIYSPGGGIMHTKMRIFEWQSQGKPQAVLFTGSLNPDDSSLYNDETLLKITNADIIDQYSAIYEAIRAMGGKDDDGSLSYQNQDYDPTAPYNVLFSKGDVDGGPTMGDTLVSMIAAETEMVLISVYTITDSVAGLTDGLKQAVANGAFVAVLTDIDQVIGSPDGFSSGDGYFMKELNYMQLGDAFSDPSSASKPAFLPMYPCKNANGTYSAFHHKNCVLGVTNMRVVTDTCNWTKAGTTSTKTSTVSKNAESGVANCETTLILNSTVMDENATALSFVDTIMQLFQKYYVYTVANIADIVQKQSGGSCAVLYPDAAYDQQARTLSTPYFEGSTTPRGTVTFPYIYTPQEVAEIMLQMPSLSKNADLKEMLTKYANASLRTE